MERSGGRRTVTAVVPMIIGIIAAQRAMGHVRDVDFLLLFTGGAAFGIGLGMVLSALGRRKSDQS